MASTSPAVPRRGIAVSRSKYIPSDGFHQPWAQARDCSETIDATHIGARGSVEALVGALGGALGATPSTNGLHQLMGRRTFCCATAWTEVEPRKVCVSVKLTSRITNAFATTAT